VSPHETYLRKSTHEPEQKQGVVGGEKNTIPSNRGRDTGGISGQSFLSSLVCLRRKKEKRELESRKQNLLRRGSLEKLRKKKDPKGLKTERTTLKRSSLPAARKRSRGKDTT